MNVVSVNLVEPLFEDFTVPLLPCYDWCNSSGAI